MIQGVDHQPARTRRQGCAPGEMFEELQTLQKRMGGQKLRKGEICEEEKLNEGERGGAGKGQVNHPNF